ncbi:MAG: CvpA family protein [Sulfuricurvum sp.]|jgi:membrane protein required for colicin V production|nr:CvpA family protein [Sulfuricurvum sp.]MDP3023755.1 CvpA family protein [Sulfuricurvum sp.]MDP3119087.1 CvpA family protein [Sulfuricurvum sp.]
MNYFDVAVGSIVLLLGLKGLMNGFSKELFGLIGIVGGLFVASHIGGPIGRFLNESLLHFETSAAVNLVGFVFTVGIFWLLMVALGAGFKRLSSLSGLGIVDQILGFFVGASKFFFIMSVIVYALFSVTAIRENFGDKMKDSVFFEPMVATGDFILHIETGEVVNMMSDSNESDSHAADDKDQEKEK